jgi:hypothetical protein
VAIPAELGAALLALCAVLLIALLLLLGRPSRRARRHVDLGARAEARALSLLRREGFALRGSQVGFSFDVLVDGAAETARGRADFLVEKEGRLYVVEVKTGGFVRPTEPNTRRQLLEYLLALPVDGVLLVDGEADEIHTIRFRFGDARAVSPTPGV